MTAPHIRLALCDRARKIALRIAPWPTGEAFSAFYHREAFVLRCRMMDRHNRVYREVFARLAEKSAAAQVERDLRFTMELQKPRRAA